MRIPDHMFGMQSGFFLLLCLGGALALAFVAAAAIRPWSSRHRGYLSHGEAAILIGGERRAVVAALAFLRVAGAITVRGGKVAVTRLSPVGFGRLEAAVFYAIAARETDSLSQILDRRAVRQDLDYLRSQAADEVVEPEIFTNIRKVVTGTVAVTALVLGMLLLWRVAWGFLIGGPATVLLLLANGSPWRVPRQSAANNLVADFQARMADQRDDPLRLDGDPYVAANLVAAYGEALLWDADPALRAVLARPRDDYHGRHRDRLAA